MQAVRIQLFLVVNAPFREYVSKVGQAPSQGVEISKRTKIGAMSRDGTKTCYGQRIDQFVDI